MTYTRPLSAHRYIAALLLAVSGLLLVAAPARAKAQRSTFKPLRAR